MDRFQHALGNEATLRNARLLLAIAGCVGWLEFVLTQAAQYWLWLPWLGWGLVHGLDLLCAVGGTALLLVAWFLKPAQGDGYERPDHHGQERPALTPTPDKRPRLR
jgi:hypothetical protein